MGYWTKVNLNDKSVEMIKELNYILKTKKKTEIIEMALQSLLINNIQDNARIMRINSELRIEYNAVGTKEIEKMRSLQSKRITIVKNSYRYVFDLLQHSFSKINMVELLKNIELQKEICKVNEWEYEEQQLNELYKIVERGENKENFQMVESIRNYLSR